MNPVVVFRGFILASRLPVSHPVARGSIQIPSSVVLESVQPGSSWRRHLVQDLNCRLLIEPTLLNSQSLQFLGGSWPTCSKPQLSVIP
jgi:hypothetical protein